MQVFVDTSIWSLALRRSGSQLNTKSKLADADFSRYSNVLPIRLHPVLTSA
ncbi:MAG TPA: hypothetical protein VMH80_01135 [Bryobacteraceae bacterium]|nr:hypothetical protein [Bryobacteraceae bacterium]